MPLVLAPQARAAGCLPPALPGFRVPGWSKDALLAVNGHPIVARAASGQWASIERLWQSGDTVTITIPMELRTVPVDRQHPDRVAIMYGPITLAQDEACCRRLFSIAPTTALTSRLIKEGAALRFRITNTVPDDTRATWCRSTRFLDSGRIGSTSTSPRRPSIETWALYRPVCCGTLLGIPNPVLKPRKARPGPDGLEREAGLFQKSTRIEYRSRARAGGSRSCGAAHAASRPCGFRPHRPPHGTDG
jgi:hypothetical protein